MELGGDEIRREVGLPDLAATQRMAGSVAARARPGDVIALRGELGAGKTEFARAFVHARERMAGAAREDVPSPTFTLVQLYELPSGPIYHFDLYRLEASEEVYELGLEEALAEGIVLVEWPERLGSLLPADRLDLALRFGAHEGERVAAMIGFGERGRRLASAA